MIASAGGMRMMKKHGFVGSSWGCSLMGLRAWALDSGGFTLSSDHMAQDQTLGPAFGVPV